MPGLVSLVLADARFPGGGHVHSGGLEQAVAQGLVDDVASLHAFLRGRLRTAGLVACCVAAATAVRLGDFAALDAALDARTPSAAQREASRAQGKASLRAARAAWPSPELETLVAVDRRPHHPLLAGLLIGLGGAGSAGAGAAADNAAGTAADAARCVGYLAVSGPASAAVRLLGLDPFAVNAAVVALGPELDAIAEQAVAHASGPLADLPAPGAPVLDLMAESHVRRHHERVCLFAS
ncbi:urease accessory protein UreF [Pseudonocardia phyllosphaerae]|uniref:urease accessory protein UreF n=1 Tax=Pseudonocardia phyllosphaerae TaxID=3390502 RepID=UPI00397CDD11